MADATADRPTQLRTPGRMPGLASLLAGQFGYQVRLLLRTPRAVLAGLALPVLLLLLRGSGNSGGGRVSDLPAQLTGLVVLGVVTTAYVTHAAGLVASREAGVLRRWRGTPLPAWCYFAGRISATVAAAVASGAVTVLAAITMLGMRVGPGAAMQLLLVLAAGAVAWSAVGTAVTAFIPTADSALPLLTVTYLPVVFLSGVLFSSDTGAPGWLEALMRWLPARPLVDLAGGALGVAPSAAGAVGRVAALSERADLAVLATWAVAGLLASLLLFRWDPTPPTGSRVRPANELSR
jgi:ABC-2 type transport system permease protein